MGNIPDKGPSPYRSMHDITINPNCVKKWLKNLKPYKTSGPDGLPTYILRAAADELANMLSRRHHELVSKFNVGLKSLLHQGLSEPEFYVNLVYKFKKIMGRTGFSDQFRKIIIHHKRIGYDLNVIRQSACLVINPTTADNFAALFN